MSRLLCQAELLRHDRVCPPDQWAAPVRAPIGNRTLDLLLTMETLYRLSYWGGLATWRTKQRPSGYTPSGGPTKSLVAARQDYRRRAPRAVQHDVQKAKHDLFHGILRPGVDGHHRNLGIDVRGLSDLCQGQVLPVLELVHRHDERKSDLLEVVQR